MSIRINTPPLSAPGPMQEARSVLVRSLGLAAVAAPVPVLGGALGTLAALSGFLLFSGLLFAVERGLALKKTGNRIDPSKAAAALSGR